MGGGWSLPGSAWALPFIPGTEFAGKYTHKSRLCQGKSEGGRRPDVSGGRSPITSESRGPTKEVRAYLIARSRNSKRDSVPAAEAQRRHSAPNIAPGHFGELRDEDARAGGPQGMAEPPPRPIVLCLC